MDVYNMYAAGDYTSYSSLRNSVFRDYEKYPYGSIEGTLSSKPQKYQSSEHERKNHNQKSTTSSKNCPFCKEQKKRPLGAYLRKRELAKRDDKIFEEEEEDGVESNETHHHHDNENEQPQKDKK